MAHLIRMRAWLQRTRRCLIGEPCCDGPNIGPCTSCLNPALAFHFEERGDALAAGFVGVRHDHYIRSPGCLAVALGVAKHQTTIRRRDDAPAYQSPDVDFRHLASFGGSLVTLDHCKAACWGDTSACLGLSAAETSPSLNLDDSWEEFHTWSVAGGLYALGEARLAWASVGDLDSLRL
jgi:hypothetical protein